jgi:hypothetical protein
VAPSPGTRGMARRRTRKCRRLRAGLPVVTFDPGWPGVPTSKCKLTRASSARRRTPMRSGENSDPMIPEFEIASGKRCLYCAESSAWKKSGNRLSTACIFSSSHSSPFGFAMPGIACTPEAFSKSANQLLMGIFQSYSVRALGRDTRMRSFSHLGTARRLRLLPHRPSLLMCQLWSLPTDNMRTCRPGGSGGGARDVSRVEL